MRRTKRMTKIGLAALVAGGLVGCEQERELEPRAEGPQAQPTQQQPGEIQAEERAELIEEITEEPQAWYGKTVELEGEIDDIEGNLAFTLEEEGWGGDEILVLLRQPMQGLQEDATVIARGKVAQLVITEVERELGWDLDPQIEIEFENKPVLIADSVQPRGAPQAQAREQQPGGAAQPTGAQGQQAVLTDIMAVAATTDPSSIVGRPVQLQNVTVRRVQGGNAFWVGPSHSEQVFVGMSAAPGQEALQEGQAVNISGVVAEVPPADQAQQQWKLDPTTGGILQQQRIYIRALRVEPAGRT